MAKYFEPKLMQYIKNVNIRMLRQYFVPILPITRRDVGNRNIGPI